MLAFGPLLRSCRLRAGLGLRTLAGLIDQRASTVSAIESQRCAPWRSADRLSHVAEVLGLVESSPLRQRFLELARKGAEREEIEIRPSCTGGTLLWWLSTENAPQPDRDSIDQLAEFVGAEPGTCEDTDQLENKWQETAPSLTELAIEWRVRSLLGRRNTRVAAAPVDVEAVLENEAGVRLEVVAGLVPRFSVQACAVQGPTGITLLVDRIAADSRPLASYRHLLASCYAPAALWDVAGNKSLPGDWFLRLQASDAWSQARRDCGRFALAMMLPAGPVLVAAEAAYQEMVEQQGWVEPEVGIRTVRNRLAEQFAVPPAVVHRRLVGWPCHIYGRIAQALAAEEPILPPADWIAPADAPRQRTFFESGVWQEA